MRTTVTLDPWGSGDLPLLERLMGDPRTTKHLGGPKSPDKLRERQGRYERLEGGDRMFKIVDVASGTGIGSVGFWTKEWHGEQVCEVGWMVVPECQGRGIAVAATVQTIELANAVLGGRDGWDAAVGARRPYGGAWKEPIFVLEGGDFWAVAAEQRLAPLLHVAAVSQLDTHHPEDATPADGVTFLNCDPAEAVRIALEAAGRRTLRCCRRRSAVSC